MGNTWKPWSQFQHFNPVKSIDDIKRPPCGECKNFSPRLLTDKLGDYAGIRLCIADTMYFDFSCFQSYKVENKS